MTGTQESTSHIISLNLHSIANIGGKTMKTANIYRCTAGTRKDRVNLYYINCNAAHTIREKDNKTTEILNRYGNSIAVFVSE